MLRHIQLSIGVLLLQAWPGLLVAAELRLGDPFTDHAVLQQGVTVPVWGTAAAGDKVTVRFDGQTESTIATKDGSWRVELAALEANRAGRRMTVESGDQRREIADLLVGEVWYASGQSNMQMNLAACAGKIPQLRKYVDADATSGIRFLRIDAADSPQPLARLSKPVTWQLDRPDLRQKQSAVAYFFAFRLCEQLGVPVGIVEGSWGGKPIEGFIPRAEFQTRDLLRPILNLALQDKLDKLAALKGGVVIRNTAGMPGQIYNARVAPIAPFALRGFLWYQGESNAGRGEDPRNYRYKMDALASGWRRAWGQSDLPFYFVQLPAFKASASGWIRLREEQRLSLSIPDSGMAVTIDLRDDDIHPANKLDVGNRLAAWALARTYGQEIPFSGPLFHSATIEGDSIVVEFEHADGGLMVANKEGLAPPVPTPDVALAHFEIADASGRWFAAEAVIEGKHVHIRSSKVTSPRAVRYACHGAPSNANLYNRAGLPASPFCSDLDLLPWQPSE